MTIVLAAFPVRITLCLKKSETAFHKTSSFVYNLILYRDDPRDFMMNNDFYVLLGLTPTENKSSVYKVIAIKICDVKYK